jgi:hypothetical protein
LRNEAKKFLDLSKSDLEKLLNSDIHEHRFIALTTIRINFEKEKNEKIKKELFEFSLKNIKSMEDKINNYKQNKADAKDKMKALKDRTKAIKNSLLQEYILYTKCMHIKYKNNRTQKNYKLLK